MRLKDILLMTAILAATELGYSQGADVKKNVAPVSNNVKLEQSVNSESRRPYVQTNQSMELIRYDNTKAAVSNKMPITYYSFADKKMVSHNLATNQAVYDGVLIEGDCYFMQKTLDAMKLIKEKDPEDYRLIVTNARKIEMNGKGNSEAYAEGIISISKSWYSDETSCYAGNLSHEAGHILYRLQWLDQYSKGITKQILTHDEKELAASLVELRVAKKLNARYSYIYQIKERIGDYKRNIKMMNKNRK